MKNKFILIILTFFIIFSFSLSSFSHAGFNVSSNNQTISLPDLPEEVASSKFFIVRSR